jgi:vacuolar-type H+-ATPase subunit E/Vma4
MTATVTSSREPRTLAGRLDPVRVALLEDAGIEADRILTEARHGADEAVAAAEQEVAAEVAEVERRQAISAAAHADQVRARARAEAHSEMLGAREGLHQDLLEAVRLAALDLRNDERYPALLDHFEAVARAQLGPDAQVERDPSGRGGIVAVAGTRRVDYTLTTLAERALRDHAEEVASLWT